MAFLETVLVARTNRRREEPIIDLDQELMATTQPRETGGIWPPARRPKAALNEYRKLLTGATWPACAPSADVRHASVS
jgi:hypothetical protein